MVYRLPNLPSEYIKHQVHATFMDDEVGLHNIDFTGYESLMWGSDYPHSEGTWPNTRSELERLFQGLKPERARRDHRRNRGTAVRHRAAG